MQTTPALALGVVLIGGMMIAFQAPINAMLGRSLGSALGAAAVSFLVGTVALIALTLLRGEGGAFLRIDDIRPWLLIGGALGAFYVWAALWAVPVLGALTTMSAVIFGQLLAALVIDHFGLLGLPIREIGLTRIAAAALVAAGLVLSRY